MRRSIRRCHWWPHPRDIAAVVVPDSLQAAQKSTLQVRLACYWCSLGLGHLTYRQSPSHLPPVTEYISVRPGDFR